MAENSGIEWTDTTWNPVSGCTRASEGCDNCYAVTMTHRLAAMGQSKYAGLTVLNGRGDRHFNGKVKCHDDSLDIPLRWRKPRRVFVNSMSDLFHKDVPFEFVDKVFAVMALTPQHAYQILTKRPERMADYLNNHAGPDKGKLFWQWAACMDRSRIEFGMKANFPFPLSNVWLGCSAENQEQADKRIPHLLMCPAAARFLSCEPLLGPIDLSAFFGGEYATISGAEPNYNFGVNWVIVGCESGRKARPMATEWARSLRDRCNTAGVAFFMKQMKVGLPGKVSGEIDDFPEDLRVRKFPKQSTAVDTAK